MKMLDPRNKSYFGIVQGDRDYYLTEEPVEIEHGVYVAEVEDDAGNKFEVEIEGGDDGDFDFDNPYGIE